MAFPNEDLNPALLELHKKPGASSLDGLLVLHVVVGSTCQMKLAPVAACHTSPFTFRPLGEDR